MRLSDILSAKPADQYVKIEGFLEGKPLKMGKVKNIDIGNIRLNFFVKSVIKWKNFVCITLRNHKKHIVLV